MDSRPKRLLDQVRETIQLKHYSARTGETYIGWIKRYILFHNKRHPRELGAAEIEAFLTYLVVAQRVAASTQNLALCALLFLYREVLHQDLGDIQAVRAKRPHRLPTVLTREQILRGQNHQRDGGDVGLLRADGVESTQTISGAPCRGAGAGAARSAPEWAARDVWPGPTHPRHGRGLLSHSSLGRFLRRDALKPWRYRYWLFPRDPDSVPRACVILDLYAGFWEGQRLGPVDYVPSADDLKKRLEAVREFSLQAGFTPETSEITV